MKTYRKRLIAMVLALIMVLSIPFSTFADAGGDSTTTTPGGSGNPQGKTKELEDAKKALESAINEAENYQKTEDYKNSKVDKKTFTDALATANTIKSSTTATKEAIEGATTSLNTAYQDLKLAISAEKEAAKLAKKKEEAKEEIDKMEDLSKEEKDKAKKAVDDATDENGVTTAKNNASATNEKNKKAKEDKAKLDKAKEEAKAEIDKLSNLTADQKKAYKVKVDKATTSSGVSEVLAEAEKIKNKLDITSADVNSDGYVDGYVKTNGNYVEGATVTFYDYNTDKIESDKTDNNGYFKFHVGRDYYRSYRSYRDYYKGHRVYKDSDGYCYYDDNNNVRHYLGRYDGYDYGYGRRAYLIARKDGYEASSKYYINNYYNDGYNGGYWGYKSYRVYPTEKSRTSTYVKGYLPSEKGKTIAVYSSDYDYRYDGYRYDGYYRNSSYYLGSATIDSDGYFTINFNRSVGSYESLYYYIEGYKGSSATEPTMTVASPGTRTVKGRAGAYAGILLKDSDGYKLGSTTADKDGYYTCYINRDLKPGEKITVIASETNKNDSSAVYVIAGESASGKTFARVAYIKGYPDGTFKAQNNVTRAEAAQMFATLLNNGTNFGTSSTTKFTDANNSWYSPAINFVAAKDLISGYSDGTFKPNAKITRAEFAQMISGYIKAGYAGSANFKDVKGHWASDAIDKVYGNKSVKGYPDGSFKPNQNITRAEAVTILNSVFNRYTTSESLKNISSSSLKTFSDLSGSFWGYYQILDASNSHISQKLNENTDEEVWK